MDQNGHAVLLYIRFIIFFSVKLMKDLLLIKEEQKAFCLGSISGKSVWIKYLVFTSLWLHNSFKAILLYVLGIALKNKNMLLTFIWNNCKNLSWYMFLKLIFSAKGITKRFSLCGWLIITFRNTSLYQAIVINHH